MRSFSPSLPSDENAQRVLDTLCCLDTVLETENGLGQTSVQILFVIQLLYQLMHLHRIYT